jgi:hypothetical protein
LPMIMFSSYSMRSVIFDVRPRRAMSEYAFVRSFSS